MTPIPGFEWSPGLVEAIEAAGIRIWQRGEGWEASDPAGVASVVAAHDAVAAAKAERLAALRDYRWQRQEAGCTVAGVPMDTSGASRANITAAVVLASMAQAAGQPFETQWAAADGNTYTLTAAQMIGVGVGVGGYVAACFAAQAVHAEAIQALATWQDVQEYDFTTGWP